MFKIDFFRLLQKTFAEGEEILKTHGRTTGSLR